MIWILLGLTYRVIFSYRISPTKVKSKNDDTFGTVPEFLSMQTPPLNSHAQESLCLKTPKLNDFEEMLTDFARKAAVADPSPCAAPVTNHTGMFVAVYANCGANKSHLALLTTHPPRANE